MGKYDSKLVIFRFCHLLCLTPFLPGIMFCYRFLHSRVSTNTRTTCFQCHITEQDESFEDLAIPDTPQQETIILPLNCAGGASIK
ncbi:hypothetical protein AM587_10006183 [Phytophthora nicotianae]|uniref:Uncharacterized protein n=1 Tax=Phytophthora nicotianae TaxID=4792 RepID=A0A0W8D7Y2_PHYNI|nr:hypothetical protein AM587_10006183 [Phytophthora nicotianae]